MNIKSGTSRIRRLGLVFGFAAIFTGAITAPAFALSKTDTRSESSALASDAIIRAMDAYPNLFQEPGQAQTSIPNDASAGIVLSDGTAGRIKITLPNFEDSSDAVQSDAGLVIYPSRGPATNAARQTRSGVQLLSSIATKAAGNRYSYRFDLWPGQRLVREGDEILIVDAVGNVDYLIEAAWAVDANAKAIPTHYEIAGSTVTQVIDFDAVANLSFPVVADPAISINPGCSRMGGMKNAWKYCHPKRYHGSNVAEADSKCIGQAVAQGLIASGATAVGAAMTGPIDVPAAIAVGTITFGGNLLWCYISKD